MRWKRGTREGSDQAPGARADRLAGLDTLRSVAIVSVIVCHLDWMMPRSLAPVVRFGWMGVDLFFVLSGYLIGSQLLRPVSLGRRVEVLAFYRNRAYRILPAYLVVLAAYVAIDARTGRTGMAPLWEFLTFTENLFVDYAKDYQFLHAWSLCVEEHFYLLLPGVVALLAWRPALWKTLTVLVCLLGVGVGLRSYELMHGLRHLTPGTAAFEGRYYERIYYPTYTRLDGLLFGVMLALTRVFRPTWWSAMRRWANWLLVGGCVLVGCAVWMFADVLTQSGAVAAAGAVIGFPVLALGLALWVAAAADTGCWLGRVRVPGAKLVATLAFSLYLTHREVGRLDEVYLKAMVAGRDWRSTLLLAGSCLLAAGVLYLCVERPFLMLRDRRKGRTERVDVEARVDPAL
jgi:peptidoglycan/LPS O-acetylase OafA/YrhL